MTKAYMANIIRYKNNILNYNDKNTLQAPDI